MRAPVILETKGGRTHFKEQTPLFAVKIGKSGGNKNKAREGGGGFTDGEASSQIGQGVRGKKSLLTNRKEKQGAIPIRVDRSRGGGFLLKGNGGRGRITFNKGEGSNFHYYH